MDGRNASDDIRDPVQLLILCTRSRCFYWKRDDAFDQSFILLSESVGKCTWPHALGLGSFFSPVLFHARGLGLAMTTLSLNATERAEIHQLSPFSYMPEGLSAPFPIREDIYHFNFFISVIFPWAIPSTASYPIFSFSCCLSFVACVRFQSRGVPVCKKGVHSPQHFLHSFVCVFCCVPLVMIGAEIGDGRSEDDKMTR